MTNRNVHGWRTGLGVPLCLGGGLSSLIFAGILSYKISTGSYDIKETEIPQRNYLEEYSDSSLQKHNLGRDKDFLYDLGLFSLSAAVMFSGGLLLASGDDRIYGIRHT